MGDGIGSGRLGKRCRCCCWCCYFLPCLRCCKVCLPAPSWPAILRGVNVSPEEVMIPSRHGSSTLTKPVNLTPYDLGMGVPTHLESIPLDDTASRSSSLAPTQAGLAFPSRTLASSSMQGSSTSYKPVSAQNTQLPGGSPPPAQLDLPASRSAAQAYQSLPQDEPTKD